MMATATARLAAASGQLELALQAAQQQQSVGRNRAEEGPRLRTYVPALMLAARQGAGDAAAQVRPAICPLWPHSYMLTSSSSTWGARIEISCLMRTHAHLAARSGTSAAAAQTIPRHAGCWGGCQQCICPAVVWQSSVRQMTRNCCHASRTSLQSWGLRHHT